MKRFLFALLFASFCFVSNAQNDTTSIELDAASVVSLYRNSVNVGSLMEETALAKLNYGQEPSNVFKSMPSIISLSDNGTEFGYGYFRIRGLDQTRINVTLDGCPWNEAEDFGTYFANSPDLMSSMKTIKVERGSGASYNGVAGSAGGINLESVDIFVPSGSYGYVGAGSFNTFKTTVVYNMRPRNGWGLHMKATQSQTDGYRDHGFNNSQAFTVKAGYKFNERHSLDILSMNGYHRNGQGWLGNTPDELRINPRANGCTEKETDNWFMSMNRLQYKGWISEKVLFTSSVYYQGQTGGYRMDLDNYMRRMCDAGWGTTNILYDYGMTHNMLGCNAAAKAFLGDVVLCGGINAYDYGRRHFSGDKSENVPEEEKYDNKGNKVDANCFLNASYKPVRWFSINGNVQYRHVDFSYVDNLNPSMSFSSADNGSRWNFVNFGAGMEFYAWKNSRIYLRYSRVDREPTRSDMFGGNEYYIGELNTVTPETANDAELGIESVTERVKCNINGFYMWFDNELVLNGEYGLNGLPCHENARKSFRTGVEATVDWNIAGHLFLNNSGSYSCNRVNTETYGEKTHVLSPSFTWNSDLVWDGSVWSAGLNFNYRSKMFADMVNEHTVPELWTLNLYGSYRINRVELGLRFNNITNRTNYCTGTVGVNNETLYMAMAGFNFFANLIFYF